MAGKHTIGWIGLGDGRVHGGACSRPATRERLEPHARQGRAAGQAGRRIVETPAALAGSDIVFLMVSTGKDLDQVCFGKDGVASGGKGKVPKSSSTAPPSRPRSRPPAARASGTGRRSHRRARQRQRQGGEGRQALRRGLRPEGGVRHREALHPELRPARRLLRRRGRAVRFCKIAHNVMLGVVIQNLAEITILAQKAGVPRHAFLEFMNNSVMGSMFTRYKSNALVNLDWTTTFTPELLRKDLDLGLEAGAGSTRRCR